MKKLLAILFLAVVPAFVFTACSDDDDPEVTLAQTVAGTYEGSFPFGMDMNGDGQITEDEIVTMPATVVVSATAEKVVSITVSFSAKGLPNIGDLVDNLSISIPNVAIGGTEGNVTIAEQEFSAPAALIATVKGDLEGTIKNSKNLVLNVEIDEVLVGGNNAMPDGLDLTVTATKK